MGQHLHIYAVNERLEGRHTFLSRAQGEAGALPDLAGWLGLRHGGLDTDEIELFPTADLAGMTLTDYVRTAFDLEADPDDQITARLNALDGHVFLVPDIALAGEVKPKPQLTHIAALSIAQPDHSAQALEPVSTPATPEVALSEGPPAPTGSRKTALIWTIGVSIVVGVLFLNLLIG